MTAIRCDWLAVAALLLAVACTPAPEQAPPPATPETVTVVDGDGYFPVAIRLESGEILAVLRGGGAHVGRGGRLDLVRSADGGQTWSAPQMVIDGPEDDRNPAFGVLTDGTLLLGFVILSGYDDSGLKFASERREDRKVDGVYLMRSEDNGKSWSEPERSETIHSFYEGQGTVSAYGKIIQLDDGAVLMTVYFQFHDERGHEAYVYRSRDGGRTWGDPALLGKHFNETALAILPDGRLLAAMRSETSAHLATIVSTDGGHAWTEPVVITKDREHPADLIVLEDGRVLMVYGVRNDPMGARAVLSEDGGTTWDTDRKVVLEDGAPNTDCGYPSSVQLDDGRIVTLYYQVDDLENAPQSAKAKAVIWTP